MFSRHHKEEEFHIQDYGYFDEQAIVEHPENMALSLQLE